MHIILNTDQLNNILKELAKIFIKNESYETHHINNCVLIEANILGEVRFSCCVPGTVQISSVINNAQVINPGSCLINLHLLSKKIKYLDEVEVELVYEELNDGQLNLYITTENIEGKLEGPIFSIEEFPIQHISGTAICDIDCNVFNSWSKAIKSFCSGLETLSIRVSDNYLEGCTFNSASHQTMMLYTRVATLEEYISNFTIDIPAIALNTLMTISDNNSKPIQLQQGLLYDSNDDSQILGVSHNDTIWWFWTNLSSTEEQLAIAEFCSNQQAESSIELDRTLLSKRLAHLSYQSNKTSTKRALLIELTSNEHDELNLELSMDGLSDKVRVQISNYEGNWKTQRYDIDKLINALKTLAIDKIRIEQFLTDENNPNSEDALSLRISDLQEQSRVEIYVESLV